MKEKDIKIAPFLAGLAAIIAIPGIAAFIGSFESASSTASTTTSVETTIPAPESYTVAAVGDISCSTMQRKSGDNQCQDAEVADLIRERNTDGVFFLGDIQYNSGKRKEYVENFLPIWGDLIPFSRAIIGNHDLADGAAAFYEFFPTVKKPGYYSFDIGNWHFVALNTNDDCKYIYCKRGSDQYNWLINDLQQNSGKCTVALTHHPRYSSGPHGQGEAVVDVYDALETYGVTMLLSAHDHHYERFDTTPVQIVSGAGGKQLRSTGRPAKNSSVIVDDQHGALFLEFFDYHVELQFVDVTGTVRDTATVNCVPK